MDTAGTPSRDRFDPVPAHRIEPTLHVVLFEPEIPLNTGSVGRTCVAVNAKLWLVRPLGFRIDDRQLRRAGLDYWEKLQWEVSDDWESLLARLGPRRIWMIETHGRRVYTEAAFERGDALVFGPETRGLPQRLFDRYLDRTLRLPMEADTRSLNQSNVVSVVVFEALRQIARWPGPTEL
jgi:tRNA (cytidine/uridine-2'-O-)-methyltransferase